MDTDQLNPKNPKNPNYNTESVDHDQEEDDVPLPGFRFHPLDEELVGFYLLRKVEKKPLSIELIKEIDIYKYDPWDLPKGGNSGEKEWYFFCRRGRKYRNSIRPNRVTGSGFWKATGIDRPIYSDDGSVCIGLKKSLVYYRGSAGKGTKTEWMMHEFRLPPQSDNNNNNNNNYSYNNKHTDDKPIAQEAEVWTLCRILKRSPNYKKTLPEWREVSTRKSPAPVAETSSGDSDYDRQSYISFQTPVIADNKPFAHTDTHTHHHHQHQTLIRQVITSPVTSEPPSTAASYSSFSGLDVNVNEFVWDDLRSAVDQFCVADPFFLI